MTFLTCYRSKDYSSRNTDTMIVERRLGKTAADSKTEWSKTSKTAQLVKCEHAQFAFLHRLCALYVLSPLTDRAVGCADAGRVSKRRWWIVGQKT